MKTETKEITKNSKQEIYKTNIKNIKAWCNVKTSSDEYIIRFITKSILKDDVYLRFTNEPDFIEILSIIANNKNECHKCCKKITSESYCVDCFDNERTN